MSRFQFVEDHARAYGAKRLCRILGVSRSGFYRWRAAAPARAARAEADRCTAERISAAHAASDGTYGIPRITAELRAQGWPVNHKRVARLMREAGLTGIRLRRRVRTTVPELCATPVPDLLERDFTASAPNTRNVGDITYLPVAGGRFLYLATVLDLYSRRLAGWSIAEHMRTDLVADALKAADAVRGGLRGALFHSDNGAQYASKQFAELCDALGVKRSRGAVGTSADNAAAESFNATLKRETLRGTAGWPDPHTARLAVFRWITRYNTIRRHSALGHRSPVSYETASATLAAAA